MLASLFGSQLRANVISFLMLHADESFFVRQLAGLIHEDPTNVSRELNKLSKAGILVSHTAGREKYYQANGDSPIFEELRSLAVKTSGLADVLRGALVPFSGRIKVAYIYGSFASGDNTAASDIDVMVIGNVVFKDIVKAFNKSQSLLNREINPTVYPADEFVGKIESKNHFLLRVLEGQKIFLIGDEYELAGLAEKPLVD